MRIRRPALILLLAFLIAPCSMPVFAEEGDTTPKGPDEAERKRIKELVAELRDVASEIRGLEWKKPVEADLMTREQMVEYMQKQVKEDIKPEELARDQALLRRMGYLTEDEDLLKIAIDMFSTMAAGFFNPKTKQLYLLAGQDPESQRPTIIHELLHALEDQYYDLENTDVRFKDDSDGLFAFKCLLEGSAEYARFVFEEKHPEEAEKDMAGQAGGDPKAAAKQMQVLRKTPLFLLYSTLLHYKTGPMFVKRALKGRPYGSVMEEIIKNGPTTQEQVLHPERFLGEVKDLPQEIEWAGDIAGALGEGWKKLHEMSYGELDLALWLDSQLAGDGGRLQQLDMLRGTVANEQARKAAMGWDGGRLIFFQNAEKRIVFGAALAFDTVRDAEEAMGALEKALQNLHGDKWVSGPTIKEEDGSVDMRAFVGAHGDIRLQRNGANVVMLDGLAEGEIDAAWAMFLKTKFKRDEKDAPSGTFGSPFAGCEIIDFERGTGWDLPEGWLDNKAARKVMSRADPFFLGTVERNFGTDEAPALVRVTAGARDFRLNVPRLPVIIKQILGGRSVAKEDLKRVKYGELEGYTIDVSVPGGAQGRHVFILTNTQRLFIIRAEGAANVLSENADALGELFAGIKVHLTY